MALGYRRRLRRFVEAAIGVAILALIARGWLLDSYTVVGGSMAETLWGEHVLVDCQHCGRTFPCDAHGAARPEADSRAACPNCGHASDISAAEIAAGDRLLIDRAAFLWRMPRRWEVVAFRSPQEPSRAFVKRVVGLPGEDVQIRGGDVYINGKVLSKSLAEQRALGILVHDDNVAASTRDAAMSRWSADAPNSRWSHATNGWGLKSDERTTDWLSFHAMRLSPGPNSQRVDSPILDDSSYNHAESRLLNAVTDVRVQLVAQVTGSGTVQFRFPAAHDEFVAAVNLETGVAVLRRNGATVWSSPGAGAALARPTLVEFSNIDQQLVFALDGEVRIGPWPIAKDNHDEGQPRKPVDQAAQRPAIGGQQVTMSVRDLRVYRDVYYTTPPGLQARRGINEPCRLADGEYFVLGDNSPHSDDSRTWPEPAAVTSNLLLGKPLLVYYPARVGGWTSWPIQVPDLSRIRYIR